MPLRPPLVRAGGSRLLATDQGLFASSGVDAPFTLVHARDGTWEPDLFEAQGALWGFHWIGPTVDVIRSEDGGTTFVKVRSIAVAGAPKQLAVTTDAVPFVLVGDALLRAPTDDPGSALDVFAAAPPQPGSASRVLVHGAGVVVLNAYDGLEVRHYASDGTLTATGKTLELRQGYVLLDTAAVAPDGRLCLLEVAYTGSGLGLGAVCSIDGFEHFTRATLPTSDWFDPAPLVVLRDGSFVFGATLTRAFEERRAVASFSADRKPSWTEATDVRPQGGFGQKVLGLAGEADGGVLAVLGDNGSLRAWTGGDVKEGELRHGDHAAELRRRRPGHGVGSCGRLGRGRHTATRSRAREPRRAPRRVPAAGCGADDPGRRRRGRPSAGHGSTSCPSRAARLGPLHARGCSSCRRRTLAARPRGSSRDPGLDRDPRRARGRKCRASYDRLHGRLALRACSRACSRAKARHATAVAPLERAGRRTCRRHRVGAGLAGAASGVGEQRPDLGEGLRVAALVGETTARLGAGEGARERS